MAIIIVNGQSTPLQHSICLTKFLDQQGLDGRKVAVERNREIVPKSTYDSVILEEGDVLEIVHFIGGGDHSKKANSMTDIRTKETDIMDKDTVDTWTLANKTYQSRLIVGTGKYKSMEETAAAVKASGAEIVTVAVRRVNISDPSKPMLMDYVDPKKVTYLPNTAGCFTADDALRTLRLAREAGGFNLVKLEVLGDQKTLYPDMQETLKAAEILVKEGFDVMAYTSDDPIAGRRLVDAGCVAIMPLGAPIGSGLGIQNPVQIRLMIEAITDVPLLVDAGVGTASDAVVAMELGCDGVLMNTAIAEARDPVKMAGAMKKAVEAGREAYLAGRMPKKRYADPSSPLAGLI